VFVPRRILYSEAQLRGVVASSRSISDVLRRLGLRPAGGNHATIKKYIARWGIDTSHFDPNAIRRESLYRPPRPLSELLVERSTYHRGHLKRRLLGEGIKQALCEICGQGDMWRGRPLALVLDHINGVPDDNPLLISGDARRRRGSKRPRPSATCHRGRSSWVRSAAGEPVDAVGSR
jgi:hypothetical protein